MSPRVTVFFFALACLRAAEGAPSPREGAPETIRVLLDQGVRLAVVESAAGLIALGGKNESSVVARVAKPIRVARRAGKWEIDGKPASGGTLLLRPASAAEPLRYRGAEYRGSLRLEATGAAFRVVNHLDLEAYLAGTLANEMSASWELEALRAQAVVSRTYALHQLRAPHDRTWDVRSTVLDQVYGGARTESPRIHSALRSTRNRFLSHEGSPLKAYFHSRCGGRTETPEHVWHAKDRSQSVNVPCPYCRKYPFRWRLSVPADELMRALDVPGKILEFVVNHGPSGRSSDVLAHHPRGLRAMRSDRLRARLGYSRLKSTFFRWKRAGNAFEFEGVGSGHGVGMCQWGARYLAQNGKTFEQILTHYYPRAKLDVL